MTISSYDYETIVLVLGILFLPFFYVQAISKSSILLWDESLKNLNFQKTKIDVDLKKQNQKIPSSEEGHLAHFVHGVLSFERGEMKEAKTSLTSSLELREINPYVYYYLGRIAMEQKNFKEAFQAFKRALKLKPQYDLRRKIKLELAKVYLNQKKLKSARKIFLQIRKKFQRTETYPDILWDLFNIDEKLKYASKCRWFRYLFENYPDYSHSHSWTLNPRTWKISKRKIRCSVRFSSQKKHINQLIALGQYSRVIDEIKDSQGQLKKLEYLELLAEYEIRAGHPQKAYQELKKHYKKYKGNKKFLDIFIKVASRSLNHKEALKAFNHRIQMEKRRGKKATLVFRKAFLQYELGNYEKAYITFSKVPKIYRRITYQGDTLWYLGWTAYLQKKYKKALDHFGTLLDRLESKKHIRSRDHYSVERLKYWMAHAYQAQGDEEKAQNFLKEVIEGEKLGYYAFLASISLSEINKIKKGKVHKYLFEKLNIPWFSDFKNKEGKLKSIKTRIQNYVLSSQNSYDTRLNLSFKKQEELLNVFKENQFKLIKKRFLILMRSGFHQKACWELYELEIKSKSKDQKRALVALYHHLNDSHRASKIMTLSFEEEREKDFESHHEDPYSLWSSTYPQPHKKLVEGSADLFQVPENLVYSIMRAESFYSVTAMSRAGARGLLQLMPFTANRIAFLLGQTKGVSPQQLFEPYVNIQLGVRYLMRLIQSFQGSKVLSLAAYNAGPHRVEWWVSRFGHLRQDEFIEHILFLETRNYVKKVIKFNWIYDLLYTDHVNITEIQDPFHFKLSRSPSLIEKWDSLSP